MFEGILERVLQRALGNYIEGLDKKNLSLGVWSGNINLENVYIKRGIFENLKLPLTLRLGRIGKLQIIVPWRRLSSSPVEVIIKSKSQETEQQEQGFFKNLVTKILDNVQITIQNIHVRLENYENLNNTFSMGLTLKEITVHTTNNQWDKEFFDRTMEQNKEKPVFKVLNILKFGIYWRTKETSFIARDYNSEDERLEVMQTIYGMDEDFIQDYKDFYLLQPIQLMTKLKQVTQTQMLEKEAEYQISLEVDEFSIYLQKTQYDNVMNLMELFNDYQKFQDLQQVFLFIICSQQTRKYKFLRPFESTPKQNPRAWLIYCCECIRREVRQNRTKIQQFEVQERVVQDMQKVFKRVFKMRLREEIMKGDQNEKTQSMIMEEFKEEEFSEEVMKKYNHIVISLDFDLLKQWSQSIAKKLAERQKTQERLNQQKGQNQGLIRYLTSFGSSWLGNQQNMTAEQEQKIQGNKEQDDSFDSETSEEDEFYDAYDEIPQNNHRNSVQHNIDLENELIQLRESLLDNFQNSSNQKLREKINEKRLNELLRMNTQQSEASYNKIRQELQDKAIPFVQANFKLKYFSVSLVNNKDKHEGIEVFCHNFKINFKKFDESNGININAFELLTQNEEFGINQLIKIEKQIYKTAIVSRDKSNSDDNQFIVQSKHQASVKIVKANSNSKLNQKFVMAQNIDFDIHLQFQPVRILYQVVSMSKLFQFFKVENFKDELKLQAIEKLEALKSSVSLADVLKNKRRNKLRIEIASPIIIIPFKKNNDINSQCWIFNVGNLLIQNYEAQYSPINSNLNLSNYLSYQIEITQIMMRYSKSYKKWLEDPAIVGLQVIQEFKLGLILSVKKEQDQSPVHKEAEILFQGNMSNLNLYFTPLIYNQFINISNLLTLDEKDTQNDQKQQMVNEKNQVVKMASKIGLVRKKGTTIKYWYQFFAVLSGGYIYFYEKQQDVYPSDYFYITGVKIEKDVDKQIENTLLLTNSFGEHCLIALNSLKHQTEWEKAIQEKAFDIQKVVNINQVQQQTHVSEQNQQKSADDGKQQIDKDKIQMKFDFEIPQIQIKLLANQKKWKSNFAYEENVRDEDSPFQSEPVSSEDEEDDIGLFSPVKARKHSFNISRNSQNPFENKNSSNEDNECSWKSVIQIDYIKFKMIKRYYDSEISVSLKFLNIQDTNNPRFPNLIKSNTQEYQKALIEIKVLKQEPESPRYENDDFIVDLALGQLEVNWHPKSINRLIRFFRYLKLPSQVVQQEKDKQAKQQLQFLNLASDSSNTKHSGNFGQLESFNQISQNHQIIENCQLFPNRLMRVKACLDSLKVVLIHPINYTYPIATLRLDDFEVNYGMHYDHDTYQGMIGDLRIYDNTNYPLTLDPTQLYENDQEFPSHEILGPRNSEKKQKLLNFEIIMFSNPNERFCPHQQEGFDKNVILNIGSIKINYMQEQLFRINDYFFSQFLGALSDSNPYQKLIDELEVPDSPHMRSPQNKEAKRESIISLHSLDSFTKNCEDNRTQEKQRTFSFVELDRSGINDQDQSQSPQKRKWQKFDLQQQTTCTGLQITLDRPKIVIKDRPYLNNDLEIDLGKITISSNSDQVLGRWKSLDMKKVWVTKFSIEMKDMGIGYSSNQFEIAPSFDMKLIFEKMNYSPLLIESYSSKDIDFTELDISYKISINFSPLIMHFRQDVYTYILRCVDLNLNYTDNLAKYFQLAIWNDGSDTQKYINQEQEIVKALKNKEVYKMKVYLNFPSLALQILNKDNAFLSEFVLWNANLDFLKYIDYRKTVSLQSHTLFILHNQTVVEFGVKMKQVAIAPVSSKNFICTDSEFYNFQINNSINKLSPNKRIKALTKMNKKNFIVNMHMEADGEKLIQTKIEKLKIFIKPHIYLMIFEFFVYGMPQYSEISKDKPNFFDSDYGNAARMEVGCQILQSLLCFENDEQFQKTIACQGNTSFTYIREKLNQIKQKLIDRPNFEESYSSFASQSSQFGEDTSSRRGSTQINTTTIDCSATTKIMQVSISDLCPFFCTSYDLEGKNFKQVRKREMMSPFTLFYNRSDIIELVKNNDRRSTILQKDKILFRNYSKIEANLERTLLKLSFNDFKILKGISDHLGRMLNQEYIRLIRESEVKDKDELAYIAENEEYLNMYNDSGHHNKKKNAKFMASMFSISESPEPHSRAMSLEFQHEEVKLHHYSQSESEESDYLDPEEMKKIEMKIQQSKKSKTRRNANSGDKSPGSAENFTESFRRTSIAFNLIQQRYIQRQSEIQLAQQISEKQAQKVSEKSLYTSQLKSRFRDVHSDIINEDEELDDMDEGNHDLDSRLNNKNQESPNASKKLMKRFDEDDQFQEEMAAIFVQQISEERGVDQFQVVSYGLKILVINDNQQNFFPVLGISISEFHYSSDQNETQKAGTTQFSSALNYYNAEAGEWEPFIETFKIHFTIMEEQVNKKRMLQCELPTQFSFNITEKLVKNLSDTYKSWQVSNENSIDHGQDDEQETKTKDIVDEFRPSDSGGTQLRSSIKLPLSQQSQTLGKYTFEEIDEEDEFELSSKEEDVVTPYSISNQTNVKLLVKRLQNNNERDSNEKAGKRKNSKHIGNSLSVKGGVGASQSKLNRVYVINPNNNIDYAVDYELQVKQQMNMYNSHQFSGQQGEFIKILFEDVAIQGGMNGMSIPINSVNLNQVGCKKHYVRDDDKHSLSEFYVYGVTQVNMKKVLTIRNQYLFVNQTFFNYEVHIRFKNSSIIKSLVPGDRLPIPDSYNKCKFQIRIAQYQNYLQTEEEVLSPQNRRHKKDSVYSANQEDSVILDDALKRRGDIPNFQQVSPNWSDMLLLSALKSKLPLNRATFLKHGKTYTIIKKEAADFADAYDITFRPPLLLKNCMPVPILLEFDDSNGEYDRVDLQKQEEKHIFVFNLQQPVTLKLFIEGFQEANIILDCSVWKDLEIKSTIYDIQGRALDIYVATSTKVAGKKAIFYVKNVVINNTQQELTFYYSQPNERQIKNRNSKDIIAGTQVQRSLNIEHKKFFMLSDVSHNGQILQKQEIYGTIEGSNEVSNPINIFNPGSNDEYVYSKITQITPSYVFVNHTKQILIAAQKDAKEIPFVIPTKERVSFHWANKNKEMYVCLKLYNDNMSPTHTEQIIEYDWSCGFPISELGTLSVQNRQVTNQQTQTLEFKKFKTQKNQVKYLRVDRRLHNNTIFIIVEEENTLQPTYKIENFSNQFALRYHQVDQNEKADLINVNKSTPYAWTDYLGVHELEIDLFHGDLEEEKTYYVQGIQLRFALDQLNYKQIFKIPVGFKDEIPLYVCTFTNGYTKVIRFSDIDNTHITATNQEDKGEDEDENSQQMSIYELYLSLSVISDKKELIVMYMQGIYGKLVDTEKDTKTEFKIGYLQIDNQSENDPIYPVLLKPKYLKPENDFDDDSSNSSSQRYNINFNQQGVFELCLDFRKNIPHVVYFEQIEYLMQTFELKLEFSHILQISKFVQKIGAMLNKNLTWMHQIFEQDGQQIEEEPDFFKIKESTNDLPLLKFQNMPEESNLSKSGMKKSQGFGNKQMKSEILKSKRKVLMEDVLNDEEENKGDVQIQSSPKRREMLKRGLSTDSAMHFSQSKLLKKRTVASSLHLGRNQSTQDNQQQNVDEGGSSLKKHKSHRQEILLDKIRSQDQQMMRMNTKVHKENWKSEEFKQQAQRIYIKEYRSSPIDLEVSVMNKATFEMDESDIFKTISSLGLVISSIDEAPIKLNALVLKNVFGNYDDVVTQIKKHHIEKFKWNVLKFIGASNLLGNPMNFVNSLGTGVQDFFYQPRQGFVKGPIQGGIGIIKGTGSLVKNTFIGTIGSASKMVSSVSKGLLVLSNDKEYIYKRDVDNIKKRPKNIMQGINLGLRSALNSVGSGISGVVKQPIEETKKGGFVGFLKGTAKGVTGLMVKPMSGALDFLSLTTEGIKNTSKKEEELAQNKRLRLPRPFYENERIIREYDDFHAFWINLVPRLRPDISCEYFFEACMLECTDTSWSIMFLTLNNLVMIQAEQRPQNQSSRNQKPPVQIKWLYETKRISYVEVIEDTNLTIGFNESSINLELGDTFMAEKVRSKIEKIMKSFK